MSTHRNGGDQLSGEAQPPEAAPRLDPTAERDRAFNLDDIAELIGEALRQPPADDRGEQAALAAFRSHRATNNTAVRTRRRDDWRPAARKQRWARGGALALAASTLLGGIAVASIGVVDSAQQPAPEVPASSSPLRPPAPTRDDQGPPPTGPVASSPASPSRPGTAKDLKAHCRAYEKGKGRSHALKATAWQRLVRAAGGERQIPEYCAQLTASAADRTPAPGSAGKADKTAKPKTPERTGGDPGKPSDAKPQQSKGPSDRRQTGQPPP